VPYAELAVIRQQVVLASTRVVGAMSRIRLGDICDDFIAKLKERVVAPKNVRGENSAVRGQVLKLCQGGEARALLLHSSPSMHLLAHSMPIHQQSVLQMPMMWDLPGVSRTVCFSGVS
jgi:hypothetical protein